MSYHLLSSATLSLRLLPRQGGPVGFYSQPLPVNQQRPEARFLELVGCKWGAGGQDVAAYLEGPAITNMAILQKQIRHTQKSVLALGWGHLETLTGSSPGSRSLQLPPKPDLLLIWFQMCLFGPLHEVQEVPVAVSGHDGVPRGAA